MRRALSLAVDQRKWMARYLDGHSADQGPVPSAMRQVIHDIQRRTAERVVGAARPELLAEVLLRPRLA